MLKKFSLRVLMLSAAVFVVVSTPAMVYGIAMIAEGRGSEEIPLSIVLAEAGVLVLTLVSVTLTAIAFRRVIWDALRDLWRDAGEL